MISIASRRVVLNASLQCQKQMKVRLQPSHMNVFRALSSLPYHLVVGMPALSPTMEAGTISAWNVKEGDAFSAGDSLADIETDKASIAFEAQDDGVVAKILVAAGIGEVKVGTPIMVTVEEEDSVAAFKNFVPEASPLATPKPKEEKAAETPAPPVVSVPSTPAVTSASVPPPTPPLNTSPVVASTAVPASVESPTVVAASVPNANPSAPTVGPSWGSFAKVRSPLAAALSKDQKKYIEMYGSTGQIPL